MTYFIHATLTIKYGSLPKLTEIMKDLISHSEDRGLRLLGAYYPVVGNFNKITHIWQVKDLESMDRALSGIATNPEIVKTISQLAECVEQEELQLVMKTPYSP